MSCFGVLAMVISTDNDVNLHIVVISNYRKVVSWVTIFLLDNPITMVYATFKFDISITLSAVYKS